MRRCGFTIIIQLGALSTDCLWMSTSSTAEFYVASAMPSSQPFPAYYRYALHRKVSPSQRLALEAWFKSTTGASSHYNSPSPSPTLTWCYGDVCSDFRVKHSLRMGHSALANCFRRRLPTCLPILQKHIARGAKSCALVVLATVLLPQRVCKREAGNFCFAEEKLFSQRHDAPPRIVPENKASAMGVSASQQPC